MILYTLQWWTSCATDSNDVATIAHIIVIFAVVFIYLQFDHGVNEVRETNGVVDKHVHGKND